MEKARKLQDELGELRSEQTAFSILQLSYEIDRVRHLHLSRASLPAFRKTQTTARYSLLATLHVVQFTKENILSPPLPPGRSSLRPPVGPRRARLPRVLHPRPLPAARRGRARPGRAAKGTRAGGQGEDGAREEGAFFTFLLFITFFRFAFLYEKNYILSSSEPYKTLLSPFLPQTLHNGPRDSFFTQSKVNKLQTFSLVPPPNLHTYGT